MYKIVIDLSLIHIYITGVDDGYFDTASYVVMKGRGFSKNDYANARRVALRCV